MAKGREGRKEIVDERLGLICTQSAAVWPDAYPSGETSGPVGSWVDGREDLDSRAAVSAVRNFVMPTATLDDGDEIGTGKETGGGAEGKGKEW